MYSTELINNISERTGYSKAVSKEVYEALISEIKEALNHGEDVQLTNFGKFYISVFADRTITCPTGEVKKIKKHNIVKFKPGEGLKAIAPKLKK